MRLTALTAEMVGKAADLLKDNLPCTVLFFNERAIDVQVTRLRRKIEPDPGFPRYLRTVRGQGYRLVDA